jgi:ankyrin repeat protein
MVRRLLWRLDALDHVVGFAAAALLVGVVTLGAAGAPTLPEAARRGDAAAVRAMLGDATDPDSTEADGTTALHWAVRRGDVAMTDVLLAAGADAGLANRYGVTPLLLAVTNGDAGLAGRLLDAGADPNTRVGDGETVLMTAARTGDVATLTLLVARGADVSAREPKLGQDAMMWAAAADNAAAITALVAAGADPDSRSDEGVFTPYLFAVRGGHVGASGALLDAGVDVNQALDDGTSALVLAVINAHYELAGFLLDRGADPNADGQGWTALHQIAWSRRHNAGFNLPGPAATGGLDSLDLASQLVEAGGDVDARVTQEPKDGNRNKLDRLGATPFLMAAKADDVPLMRRLLDLGADPALTTDRGTTALMVAAGVGIWAPGENPGTPEEALAAVTLAYEAGGGGVNDVDMDGETALHGAVYRGGNVPVMRFLMERGAKLDAVNSKGWLPLTAADGLEYTPAVLKRYPEAAALLRRAMRAQGLTIPEATHSQDLDLAAAADVTQAIPAPADVAPGDRSVWDGVYTTAQAERGRAAYSQSCAHCHLDDLLGEGAAPALAGPQFDDRWAGSSAADLVSTIRRSMPQEAPDSLGTQAYVDIASYLIQASGAQAGEGELPVASEGLSAILFTRRGR